MKKISYFTAFLLSISLNCLNSFSDQIEKYNENKPENNESIVEVNNITNISTENNRNSNLNTENSTSTTDAINEKTITKNNNTNDIINTDNKENNLKTFTNNNDSEKYQKQENNKKNLKQNSNQDNKQKKINKNQKHHIVSEGENISNISLKYGIKQQELIKLNNDIKNNKIYVGQKLILPDNASTQSTKNISKSINTSDSISIPKKDQKTDKKEPIEEKKISLSNNLSEIKDNKKTDKNQKTDKNNIISELNSTTFIWPTHGTLSSRFGYQTSTEKLKGVNIICELNSTVRASSAGVVIYSDKIDDYDNIIIIKHYNGFFTVYGHVKPIVKINDIIKKGQIIAYTTKNKQSKKSKLFFLIRKDKESYDPEKLIQTKISG